VSRMRAWLGRERFAKPVFHPPSALKNAFPKF
jgi:hypothetical protein